uniref:Uncharacterized protein n=1 Tax=Anguilla anguilla TaxID=7936 RepID=A0A0E9RBG6_ANGAN
MRLLEPWATQTDLESVCLSVWLTRRARCNHEGRSVCVRRGSPR